MPHQNRSGSPDGSFLIPAPKPIGPAEDPSTGADRSDPSPVAGSAATRPTRGHRRDWKPAFIAALRECGVVRKASEAAHINRTTAYKAADIDEEFNTAWRAAEQDFVDLVETEVVRRAFAGSDRLLELLLKSRRPHTYRSNYDVRAEIRAEIARVAAELGVPDDEVLKTATKLAEELQR